MKFLSAPKVEMSHESEKTLVKEARDCRNTLMGLADEVSLTRLQRDCLDVVIGRLWDATVDYGAEAFWPESFDKNGDEY